MPALPFPLHIPPYLFRRCDRNGFIHLLQIIVHIFLTPEALGHIVKVCHHIIVNGGCHPVMYLSVGNQFQHWLYSLILMDHTCDTGRRTLSVAEKLCIFRLCQKLQKSVGTCLFLLGCLG